MDDVEQVCRALLALPLPIAVAESTIPSGPGLYAWWGAPDVLPGITGPAHPSASDLALLYVGIGSSLRARLVDRHVRGGTGASTLRRSFAALLLEQEGYRTRWTTTRVVLLPEDERRLTEWISKSLHVTWTEHPTPDAVEHRVIAALKPPLNLDANSGHPTYATVKTARAAWRASAGPRLT